MNSLKGTGVALVTPFDENTHVDFSALEKLVQHCMKGNVNYVVALGTTGESTTLSNAEKIDVLKCVYSITNGKIPVVVGVGGNDTKTVIADFQKLPLEKAEAILSVSPYYNKPTQEGIYKHYKVLADNSPKPIIIYNVPGRTGRNISSQTTLRIASEINNVIGIKDAHDILSQVMEVIKHKPTDFLVLSGDDELVLPQLACGIDGVISVAANVFPHSFSKMVALGMESNFTMARKIHYLLMEAFALMFEENNPAGVKAFLKAKSICGDTVRMPLVEATPYLQDKIISILETINFID